MMKIDKKQLSVICVYLIILVVYNVLYFAIPFNKIAASWVCYGFSTFAVLLSCAISFMAFMNKEQLKSIVYGYPIFKVGITYLTAQFTFSLSIYIIGNFTDIPAWIPVCVSVVNLAYVLIGVIANNNAREIIEEQEESTRAATVKMTYFQLDMSSVVDKCENAELKKVLQELSSDFRYSDPVSNPQLSEIENKLSQDIKLLDELVNTDDDAAFTKARDIKLTLMDRNRRCKAMKQ